MLSFSHSHVTLLQICHKYFSLDDFKTFYIVYCHMDNFYSYFMVFLSVFDHLTFAFHGEQKQIGLKSHKGE